MTCRMSIFLDNNREEYESCTVQEVFGAYIESTGEDTISQISKERSDA